MPVPILNAPVWGIASADSEMARLRAAANETEGKANSDVIEITRRPKPNPPPVPELTREKFLKEPRFTQAPICNFTLAMNKHSKPRSSAHSRRARFSPDPAVGLTRVIELWPGLAPGDQESLVAEQDLTKPHDRLVGGKPVVRITHVTKPTIALYRPPRERANGTAMLVCPGRRYDVLAMDLEGTEVCHWLNSLGVTGALLKYRTPRRPGLAKHAAAFQDAQRAIGLLRQRAKEFGIVPNRIGVLGFSAGGHLAAVLGSQDERRSYAVVDEADATSCRPNFSVLIYPSYLMGEEQADRVASKLAPTTTTPPTFLAMTQDDPVRVETVLFYAVALRKAKVPFELNVYPRGGHAYGLRPAKDYVMTWPRRVEDWMRSRALLNMASRTITA